MKKLKNKIFRDEYLAEHVRSWIAYQVTALRHQRGLTQEDLAELTGKQQSVICRIEDPDYGPVKLSTLLSIASALDIALTVKFVPFSEALTSDLTPASMQVPSFDEENASARMTSGVHLSANSSPRVVNHRFIADLNSPMLAGDFGAWSNASKSVMRAGVYSGFAMIADIGLAKTGINTGLAQIVGETSDVYVAESTGHQIAPMVNYGAIISSASMPDDLRSDAVQDRMEGV